MKLSELRFQGTFRDYQQKVLDDSKSYLENRKIHIVAAPGECVIIVTRRNRPDKQRLRAA